MTRILFLTTCLGLALLSRADGQTLTAHASALAAVNASVHLSAGGPAGNALAVHPPASGWHLAEPQKASIRVSYEIPLTVWQDGITMELNYVDLLGKYMSLYWENRDAALNAACGKFYLPGTFQYQLCKQQFLKQYPSMDNWLKQKISSVQWQALETIMNDVTVFDFVSPSKYAPFDIKIDLDYNPPMPVGEMVLALQYALPAGGKEKTMTLLK